MDYIIRDLELVMVKLLASAPALALTGPRQSGKSTLLKHVLRDYRYITLDDPFQRELIISDPQLFLDNLGEKIIIDEIQYAPQILSYIKMRIDSRRKEKGLFVFTGSQQFNLIKNLNETLAGRIATLELLPFSYSEILRIPKGSRKKNTGLSLFINAALRGTYPELQTDVKVDGYSWYASYIQTYLERDVRTLYNIGDLRDFQRCLSLLASQVGQQLNMSSFARDLGVSVPTIKSWLSILEASRVIYLLPPYYKNSGKRITKAPKIYFIDTGLACHLTGLRDETHLMQGPMAGHLFENYCLMEVLKVFTSHGKPAPLYYLRTNNQLEVDLLIETDKLTPVEFKLAKTPSSSMASGITRLRETFARLNPAPGFVVSLTEETNPLNRKDVNMPLLDFLEKVSKF